MPLSSPSTSAADIPSSGAVSRYITGYVISVLFIAVLYWCVMDDSETRRLLWLRWQARVAHRLAFPISRYGFKCEDEYQQAIERRRTV